MNAQTIEYCLTVTQFGQIGCWFVCLQEDQSWDLKLDWLLLVPLLKYFQWNYVLLLERRWDLWYHVLVWLSDKFVTCLRIWMPLMQSKFRWWQGRRKIRQLVVCLVWNVMVSIPVFQPSQNNTLNRSVTCWTKYIKIGQL